MIYMKTMTCNQLGGACDIEFHAASFEEMGGLSKKHALEMVEKGDKDHIIAMERMKEFMSNPEAIKEWMEERKKQFNQLPEDN